MAESAYHQPAYEMLLALDGDLSIDRRKSIVDHLATWQPCRARADYVDLVISRLATFDRDRRLQQILYCV
jgi:hypothetical protein